MSVLVDECKAIVVHYTKGLQQWEELLKRAVISYLQLLLGKSGSVKHVHTLPYCHLVVELFPIYQGRVHTYLHLLIIFLTKVLC